MAKTKSVQAGLASLASQGLGNSSVVLAGQSAKQASCSEILGWLPPSPGFLIGNLAIKKVLLELLTYRSKPMPTCFIGKTGTGKTESVFALVQSLACPFATAPKWQACQTCPDCKTLDLSTQSEDFAFLSEVDTVTDWRLDSTSVNKAALKKLEEDLDVFRGYKVVYLDEVHRLRKGQLEKYALAIIKQKRSSVFWLASTTHSAEMSKDFRKTFRLVATYSLTEKEVLAFIEKRCKEFKIGFDDRATLTRMAEEIVAIPSLCQVILAEASLDNSRLVTSRSCGTTLLKFSSNRPPALVYLPRADPADF